MKKLRETLQKFIKNIDGRKVVIAVVIAACVIGSVAATQITSVNEHNAKQQGVESVTTESDVDGVSDDDSTDTSEQESSLENDKQTSGSKTTKTGSTGKNSSTTGTDSKTVESSKSHTNKENNASSGNNASGSSASGNSSSGNTQSGSSKTESQVSCTLEIRCDSISGNGILTENGHPELESYAASPQITKATVSVKTGSSVYDVLSKVCKNNGIQMESSYTPAYQSYYIEGINYLYEFNGGPNSGWMYQVNGESPNYGCSSYKVSEGDEIKFYYVTSY